MSTNKKFTILGQDWDVVVAVFANILSWFVQRFFPQFLPSLLPKIDAEDTTASSTTTTTTQTRTQTQCVAIGRPGGQEQLRVITLKPGFATCGYNMDNPTPFIDISGALPSQSVVVRVHSFSINYADCCIRWGLYESANKFVGWPIVPGFDISGVVEQVSKDDDSGLKVGDHVYGATFFGAYSTRVLVPSRQLRKLPKGLTLSQAAALPAVSLTALYTLYLGGQFPVDLSPRPTSNRSILIHSAAGGVGSMLVQMSKLVGMSKVVGVVGRSAKVDAAQALGCDVVIDKSQDDLWQQARTASPQGYAVVADANGVSTLQDSYDHLAPTGRLIVFGFHSNLPMGNDMLSPVEWLRMIQKMTQMPKFNPMGLTASNKSIMGFNLSFFVEEIEMLGILYDQISEWFDAGELQCPRVLAMDMTEIAAAHELIQSGKSVGKIVIQTKVPMIPHERVKESG
jgi:NADPH:quinone reductase-like Zn-dependent oxidoreductase